MFGSCSECDFADYSSRGGGPILGHQYIDILKTQKPKIVWDYDTREHVVQYSAQGEAHTVYYPTLQSISDRLALAAELGAGIR